MSNSHHEPCLRHSEEWDLVRGEDSVYGNEWSYLTNREGLIRYWRDGLLRSGKYENIITIGMRGERDSLMLGEDASLEPVSYTHLIHKGENGEGGRAMWDASNHLIRFITDVDFSDPSYHLPHFYELFALWAKEEDRAFFKEAAEASRNYRCV